VTKQGHIETFEEPEKAGIVGGCLLEDGKRNSQAILLALWITDRARLQSRQATAVQHQETESSFGVSETEDYGELSQWTRTE